MSIYKRRGLPRPISFNAEWNRPMPVPWSQNTDNAGDPEWGRIDMQLFDAIEEGHCLLCGDYVEEGMVICTLRSPHHDIPESVLPEYYTPGEQQRVEVADSGVLHERCAKLTLAHCPEFQTTPPGSTILKPFRRCASALS